ncbi:MAG: T9SS type A sorting domain-containing protein [Flavobacteriales bacterium]|nr:T9SS type A sorting domain-containing protein [Flavobacteriales bacterium]
MFKFCVSITFSFIYFNYAYTQNFQWSRSFGTKNGVESILDVLSDTSGGCTLNLFYQNNYPNRLDTLYFDSFKYLKPMDPIFWNILLKLNEQGKVIKTKKILEGGNEVIRTSGNLCRDKFGNIFVIKQINNSTMVFDTTTLYSKNGSIVIVKLDFNLNIVFIKQFGGNGSIIEKLFVSEGHLFFKGVGKGTTYIGSKKYDFSTNKYNSFYGELNSNTGDIKWSSSFFDSLGTTQYTTALNANGITFLNNNIFLAGYCREKFKIQKDSFNKGAFILMLDSLGRYINGNVILKGSRSRNGDTIAKFWSICSDKDKLYTITQCFDSLIFKDKKLSGYSPNNFTNLDLRICSFNKDLKLNWIYQPSISDNQPDWWIWDIITNSGYMYFSGMTYSELDFQGIKIKPKSRYDVFFGKFDYNGNVLWVANGNSPNAWLWGNDAISGKHIFFAGQYRDKIKFGKDSLNSSGQEDAWVCKLSDNSITRGKISQGPYCAGDSIDVPFTKFGEFDTSNHFIAQLSDEYGKFDSVYYEIGRIKRNKDGKVKGILPDFKVKSSANYRIRILSTSPAVQSFFRIDTLRLLIYSKDKADPGPSDTICYGDSVQIQTYGGTRWAWSPNYNISKTDVREPFVWPLKDTTYRIIISDSSGCGSTDTGYKKIVVRPHPRSILTSDTLVCSNNPIIIPVLFTSGDSNYHWSWYYVTPSKWFLLKSGEYAYSDSLTFVPDVQLNSSEKLAIILSDECSSKSDTAYITIRLNSALKLKQNISDTLVCAGTKLSYSASASGGNTLQYNWQWKDLTNDKILSLSNTLNITALKNTSIQLTLNDGCLYLADTGLFKITVNPVLKGDIIHKTSKLNDTLLCFGNTLHLFSTAQGGKGSDYQYEWYLDNNLVSTTDTFDLQTSIFFSSAGETKMLKLMVKDPCSPYPDSVLRNILVVPSPQADFTWGITCSNTPVSFTFTGKAPGITKYTWQFHGDSSNQKNPVKTLSAGKNQVQLQLTTQDGCTDNISKEVELLLQAKADFSANDVCEDSVVNFNNLSKGALSYKWSFGDGQTSDSVSPEHLYSISGSTTFNVKLLAKSGCSDSVIKAVTVHEVPNSNFSYTTSGSQVVFNAIQTNANQYTWDFGDGETRNTTDPQTAYFYDKFPSGKYTACLKISNLADCFSQTCQDILITGSVKSLNDENQVRIYPNPNSGSFTIETNNHAKIMNIRIYNSVGQAIYEAMTDQTTKKFELDLTKGVYLIKILLDDKLYCYPIIVNQ